jgi:hypothetical protein
VPAGEAHAQGDPTLLFLETFGAALGGLWLGVGVDL